MKTIITNKTLNLPDIANQATYFVSDFIALEGDNIRVTVSGWASEQHYLAYPEKPIWGTQIIVSANQVPELNAQVVALRLSLISAHLDSIIGA